MGILIVGAIIFVVAMVVYVRDSWGDLDDYMGGFLLGLLCTIGWILVAFLTSFFFNHEIESTELTNTVEISALKDNPSISGSFFLGSGTVEGEQYYYYIQDTDKGKRMDKISADGEVYIKEIDNGIPRVEEYDSLYVYKSPFARFMFGKTSDIKSETIIYLPADSVKTEFNVDLE